MDISKDKINNNIKKSKKASKSTNTKEITICNICNKAIISDDYVKADGGKTLICKKCFNKLF